MHEDEVPHGLDHRPLAVDAVMLAALGHRPGPLDCRGPGMPQLSPRLSQVTRLIGTNQQPHRVAVVELRLDVRHHLHAVDHEVGDQAVDLNVLHDNTDQPRPTQVAFAELRVGEVFVVEASHADRLGRTPHTRPDLPRVGHGRAVVSLRERESRRLDRLTTRGPTGLTRLRRAPRWLSTSPEPCARRAPARSP